MSFEHGLKPGEILNNEQLCATFKCSPQGGMRRSIETNTLLIISNHTRAVYEDRWVDGILHYTGMGLRGDQQLSFAQNKTVAESANSGVELFLFEVFEAGQYIFRGPVVLAATPYQEKQPDEDRNIRKVWVFPLALSGDSLGYAVPKDIINKKQEKKAQTARRLSDEELERRARHSRKGVGTRPVSTTTYERNEYVVCLAKRRANGVCQLCLNSAPFVDLNGDPFLETHHIVWLSKGGDDTIENTIALCPNCHRKMHVLALSADVHLLKQRVL